MMNSEIKTKKGENQNKKFDWTDEVVNMMENTLDKVFENMYNSCFVDQIFGQENEKVGKEQFVQAFVKIAAEMGKERGEMNFS